MIDWTEYAKLLVALLTIVDVPGNIPMFLQQTHRLEPRGRAVCAITAGIATATILLIFAFYGEALLAAFGITIAAFKIVGGIILLIIALQLLGLFPEIGSIEADDGEANPVAIGVFPLAMPLFAGPGSIAAVMIYAHEDLHSNHDLIVSLLIGTVAVVIVFGLLAASVASRFLGEVTQQVTNRLLGMIVGALGVEFILEGVEAYFNL